MQDVNEVDEIGLDFDKSSELVVVPNARSYPLTRAFFAVEPSALKRALAVAASGSTTGGPRDAAQEMTVTARAFAASVGVDPAATSPAASSPAAERLVHEVGNELWYIGSFPAWTAAALLVPLGADADDAAALMDGEPLSSRPDLLEVLAGIDPTLDFATDFPSRLAILDGNRALGWRGMLRAAVNALAGAGEEFAAQFSRLAGLGPADDVDCVAFALLASLTAVVDFAADGHDVLIGAWA